MTSAIWTEKYRPQTFEEVKGQKEIVTKIKAFVESGSMPHLLFSGPAGVGKTTLSLVIAKQLFGENWRQNTLELNASDERGIDVVLLSINFNKASQKYRFVSFIPLDFVNKKGFRGQLIYTLIPNKFIALYGGYELHLSKNLPARYIFKLGTPFVVLNDSFVLSLTAQKILKTFPQYKHLNDKLEEELRKYS